jgi:hypothetical protein
MGNLPSVCKRVGGRSRAAPPYDGSPPETSHFAWREAILSYMKVRWRGAERPRAASFSGWAPRPLREKFETDEP